MKTIRPISLENAPMMFAPENELGVVFLFSHVVKRLQLRIETIQPQYPDCIAYRRVGDGEKKIRIEFEFKSSNFIAHKHNPVDCDTIVCWEHDSPDIPEDIEIIELKRLFGVKFKVWIQPAIKSQWEFVDDKMIWAVSKKATPGDLMLLYRCYPEKSITDIFILQDEEKYRGEADWRKGNAVFGNLRRLCHVNSPVFLEDFQRHRVLKTSNFVRKNMQGNLHVSEYWYYLYQMIVERNPELKKILHEHKPDDV
jgi:hypothetical protein